MNDQNNTQDDKTVLVLKKLSNGKFSEQESKTKTKTWMKGKFTFKEKLNGITKTKQTVTTQELIDSAGLRVLNQLGKIQHSKFLRDVNCESEDRAKILVCADWLVNHELK